MADVTCTRCGETREGVERPPYPDQLGRRIAASICKVCWDECRNMQVMVINENRLDLSDERAQEMLEAATRNFLGFPDSDSDNGGAPA